MQSTYMRPGSASVALVLANMEDTLKMSGSQRKGEPDASWQHSDFSLYANFIQENAAILGKSSTHPQQLQVNPVKIEERDRNRFLTILSRVSRGHEGVSRQERLFVYRFWAEIQKTFYKLRNA
ncbi:hypothetical protein [Dyadobacter sp. CY323]|uniref:hypothetical protein n=1 Tax=Dyadobacter sp. CY323 TaxID=2907302 RepID=UPI001F2B199A|nr:hypothetical protein [Dyadobacter sp. CY323]MCE6990135.1 hypothetical protein [Dyadobacter sp. CY323]